MNYLSTAAVSIPGTDLKVHLGWKVDIFSLSPDFSPVSIFDASDSDILQLFLAHTVGMNRSQIETFSCEIFDVIPTHMHLEADVDRHLPGGEESIADLPD